MSPSQQIVPSSVAGQTPPELLAPPDGRERWDKVATGWPANVPTPLWRRHSDGVNEQLLDRWLAEPVERILKTDLFDEFTAAGVYPALRRHAREVTGIDVSPRVVEGALARHAGLEAVAADVRHMPFADASFDAVFSNSTLDHFDDASEVAAALRQIRRVMVSGGRLVITLDNPWNPLLAVRNRLPQATTHRLRGVDYGVGWTCGPRRLRGLLEEAGFSVQREGAVMHGPRVLLGPADRLSPARAARVLSGFLAAERLERLPTRYLTGHFVAAAATAL
jgi:SAM-dependent methyltransferase